MKIDCGVGMKFFFLEIQSLTIHQSQPWRQSSTTRLVLPQLTQPSRTSTILPFIFCIDPENGDAMSALL